MSCESGTVDSLTEGTFIQFPDWEELTLDKILSLSSGTTKPLDFSAIRQNETPYPVYGGNGVSGWTGYQCENRETLVIGRVGHYCGSVFYVNEPAWITDNALYVTEFKSDIHTRFLYFLLCHLELGKYRNKGAQPLVSQKPIYGIRTRIPPKAEQKRIAEILTCWDRAIELVGRLIEEKKVLKEAALASLLNPQKQADNKVGKWTVCQLGDLISEVNRRNKDLLIGNVLSVTNDRGFVAQNEQFSRQVASSDISNYKVVSAGEFAYNPSRINVGSIARLNNRKVGILSPMYVVFSVNGNLSADYLEQWFKSASTRGRIERSTQGSVRDSVSFSQLARLPIAVPTLEEQVRRARILQLMDGERSVLSDLKDHLVTQKRGLMQKLLTGKIRVKV